MFILPIALAGALMIQTAPATAPTPQAERQMAQVEQVMGLVNRMFGTLGTCDRVMPPELAQQLRTTIAGEQDPQAQAALQGLMASYEAGKASPEAATITQDQCMARIQAINTEMRTLQAEIQASVGAPQ